NNANVDAARSTLSKANDTVGRAQDTLKTGSATRQNAVNDARRNLDNAKSAAAQHTTDLQQDIDQVQHRLDAERATLADIEARQRDKNCASAGQQQGGSGGQSTNTTAGTASTK